MATPVKRFDVFLSSPGDLSQERQLASEVCEQINIDHGRRNSCILALLKWETHVHSAIGNSGQSTINQQIGEHYDIFVGLMSRKFGSPTGKWGSGTEEEYELAISRWKGNGKPKILFFFSDSEFKLSEVNLEQVQKVQEFKRRVRSDGVLTFDFDGETQLRTLLYSHLLATLLEISDEEAYGVPKVDEDRLDQFDPLARWKLLLESDAEVNGLHLLESATNDIAEMNKFLTLATKASSGLAKTMTREAQALMQGLRSLNPTAMQSSVKRICDSMRNTSRSYREILPDLHRCATKGIVGAQRAVTVLRSVGKIGGSEEAALRMALVELRNSTTEMIDQFTLISPQIEGIDLHFSELEAEKRKFLALLSDTQNVFLQVSGDLGRLVSFLDEKLA